MKFLAKNNMIIMIKVYLKNLKKPY